MKNQERIKAIGLLSGGLDSTLAAKILQAQGIDVLGINFFTGFCISEHRRKFRKEREGAGSGRNEALRAGKDLNIEVRMVDISEGYMDVLTKPKFGYGSAMNPCIDCRIYMLKKAAAMMEAEGARFLFTGEVLGQRPMSQHMRALRLIEKESGLEGLILRPLSAQHLPPTLPEREGWVDREKLPGFRGRGRRDQQMKLAEELGVTDYPQPAGGCCFLTDKNYARRLQDLFEHCGTDRLSLDDVIMLKVGRHFRFPGGAKVVVGRNKAENEYLEGYRTGRCAVEAEGFPGPLTLLEGEVGPDDLRLAAALTAGYGKGAGEPEVDVRYEGLQVDGTGVGTLTVTPMSPEGAREWLI